MTPEQTNEQIITTLAKRMGLCAFKGQWIEIEPYVENNQDAVYQCPRCKADGEYLSHRLPDWLNSRDALAPVLEKLTPFERERLLYKLTGNTGGARRLSFEQLNYILDIPPHRMARAIAEAIEEEITA